MNKMIKGQIIAILLCFLVHHFQLVESSSNLSSALGKVRLKTNLYSKNAKAIARNYYDIYNLSHINNPRTQDEASMNQVLALTKPILLRYCQISANNNYGDDEASIRQFIGHCTNSELSADVCAQVISDMNQSGGWKFFSASNLFTDLNNNRYFLHDKGYSQINLDERTYLRFSGHRTLFIHLCYDFFGPQTSEMYQHALEVYDTAYRTTNMNNFNLPEGRVLCSCYEVFTLYVIFVIEFGLTEEELMLRYAQVCLNLQKTVQWKKSQLIIMAETIRDGRNDLVVTPDKFSYVFNYGWRLATSTWGEYETNWSFRFIITNLPDNIVEFSSEFVSMAHAIESGFREIQYHLFSLKATLLNLGTRNASTCKQGMLEVFLNKTPFAQERLSWQELNKSDLVHHLTVLKEYANEQHINCDTFIEQLTLLERALFVNNWNAVTKRNLVTIAREYGKEFSEMVHCVTLLATVEFKVHGLIVGDSSQLRAEMARVEQNFETLLRLTTNDSCALFQSVIDNSDANVTRLFVRTLVQTAGAVDGFGSLIAEPSASLDRNI